MLDAVVKWWANRPGYKRSCIVRQLMQSEVDLIGQLAASTAAVTPEQLQRLKQLQELRRRIAGHSQRLLPAAVVLAGLLLALLGLRRVQAADLELELEVTGFSATAAEHLNFDWLESLREVGIAGQLTAAQLGENCPVPSIVNSVRVRALDDTGVVSVIPDALQIGDRVTASMRAAQPGYIFFDLSRISNDASSIVVRAEQHVGFLYAPKGDAECTLAGEGQLRFIHNAQAKIIVLPQLNRAALLDNFPVSAISFDKLTDNDSPRFVMTSTNVVRGNATFPYLGMRRFELRRGDALRVGMSEGRTGLIRTVTFSGSAMVLAFSGAVNSLLVGREQHELLPTQLEALKANEPFRLCWFATVYVATLLWSVFRYFRASSHEDEN